MDPKPKILQSYLFWTLALSALSNWRALKMSAASSAEFWLNLSHSLKSVCAQDQIKRFRSFKTTYLSLHEQSQVKPGKATTVQGLQRFHLKWLFRHREQNLQIRTIDSKAIIGKFCSIFPLPGLDATLSSDRQKKVTSSEKNDWKSHLTHSNCMQAWEHSQNLFRRELSILRRMTWIQLRTWPWHACDGGQSAVYKGS